ncbi:MAG: alpha/beta fold hydrolase [Proteobacteria bacterium]|nr:alpha/beta fold hydrolase [Pseudomonadota bacterium]
MNHLVFAHANGFPAGCYRLLFEHWRAAGWQVHALARIGHDPRYPVSSNWPHLRDELIAFAQAQLPAGERAVFAGHSLGGMLSFLVACRRPDLAQGLVMLDAPLVTGWRAQAVRLAKATRLIGRVSPGQVSRRRRESWDSASTLHQHFAAKPKFAAWDARVLADYVASGFEPDGAGDRQRLAFARDVETRIYDTLPHHVGRLLKRYPPQCPVAFLAGTDSEEMRQGGSAASRALAGPRFATIEGSHLYPFEKPDETARWVLDQIQSMAA